MQTFSKFAQYSSYVVKDFACAILWKSRIMLQRLNTVVNAIIMQMRTFVQKIKKDKEIHLSTRRTLFSSSDINRMFFFPVQAVSWEFSVY